MSKKIFYPCEIMLPKGGDLEKWSVIACDQFTSEPQYWKEVKNLIGDCKSTYNLIFPEVFLKDDNKEYINKIHQAMHNYLSKDIFVTYKDSFVYIERTMKDGTIRSGVLGMVDLEEYNFDANSESYIRPTEKTVVERIPPRKKVREEAPLELPHIVLFYSDEKNRIVNSIQQIKNALPLLYDFNLMLEGGHIAGWLLQDEYALIVQKDILSYQDEVECTAENTNKKPLFFAVGDGNHSLATAKSCWNDIKKNLTETERQSHPSRFAMVEIVNIYDESQKFEPIHRIIVNTNPKQLLKDMKASIGDPNGFCIKWYSGEENGVISIGVPNESLPLAIFQSAMDKWLLDNAGEIDYIHGDENLICLSRNKESIGFMMPTINKTLLFEKVVTTGILPRKTFSIGHAEEKRYYLEARKIL